MCWRRVCFVDFGIEIEKSTKSPSENVYACIPLICIKFTRRLRKLEMKGYTIARTLDVRWIFPFLSWSFASLQNELSKLDVLAVL